MDTATHADPDALLARFRASGAPRDLGELFDATSGDLYRVALATSPDAAAAEDAVQETFLAVIGAAVRWDPSRRAMPWLLGILRFKVARHRERTRRPADGAAGDASRRDVAAPEIADGDPEAAAHAWAEVERLEEPYRAVALLRWRYGLTPAEIAHVRGEAPGTTRSLLSRALERVRKVLKVVPAVMVLGARPARGLDAVRADVVSTTAVAPRSIPASGGLLGVRALIAAALVVAIGTAGYFALRPDAIAPRAATETADSALASATLAVPPARPIAIGALAATPVAPIAGPSARGRVVDEAGHPIPDAVISSAAADAYAFERPAGFESDVPAAPPSTRTARADADGRFAVPLDDAFPTHLLLVSAPGRAPKVVAAVRPGADVEVVLDAGEVWGGRVLDGTRAPIAGARVRACVVMPWFAFVREATTDVSGAFRLEAMPSARPSNTGPMPMTAWLTGSATGFAPTVVECPTAPGSSPTPSPSGGAGGLASERREVEIVLRRGARLSGRVVDADTGTPIPLADVRLTSTEMGRGWMGGSDGNSGMRRAQSPFRGELLAATRASAAGEFTFDQVPCLEGSRPPVVDESNDRRPFAGRLTATAEEYGTGVVLVRRVEEGGVDTRELRLWRPAGVQGRLVDRDGRPLAGVPGSIQVAPPAANSDGFTTGADGRFLVRGLPAPAAGVAAKIRVWDGSRQNETALEIRGGDTTVVPDIVIELGRRPTDLVDLRIQVVDAGGAPIWGANAQLSDATFGPISTTDRTGRAVVSIARSRFEASASIEIAVSAAGYARATARKGKDAAKDEGFVIRLETGRRIIGNVRRADGTPAAGAVVSARRGGASPTGSSALPVNPNAPVVLADVRGEFAFEDLPDDSFEITATLRAEVHSESAPTIRIDAVRSGTTGLVLRLPPDTRGAVGRLEVSVVDDTTNAPLDGCVVRLRRGEKESIWSHPTSVGRYEAREVPPGIWSVRVSIEDYALEVVQGVEVEATPRPVPLEVRMHRAEKRIVAVTGGPASGPAKDICFTAPDGSGAVAKRGADGRYTVLGLKPGTHRVTLGWITQSPPGPMTGWVADGNFVEVPSADTPVEVRLVPAGAITLNIDDPLLATFDAQDTPAAARDRSERSSLVLRDDRDRVITKLSPLLLNSPGEIYGVLLAPGRYHVRLERPGEAADEADIDIPAGSHITRTIGSARVR